MRSGSPVELVLLAPGLLGPAAVGSRDPKVVQALVTGLDLGALDRLLARAEHAQVPVADDSPEALAFRVFGHLSPAAGTDWPVAAGHRSRRSRGGRRERVPVARRSGPPARRHRRSRAVRRRGHRPFAGRGRGARPHRERCAGPGRTEHRRRASASLVRRARCAGADRDHPALPSSGCAGVRGVAARTGRGAVASLDERSPDGAA